MRIGKTYAQQRALYEECLAERTSRDKPTRFFCLWPRQMSDGRYVWLETVYRTRLRHTSGRISSIEYYDRYIDAREAYYGWQEIIARP